MTDEEFQKLLTTLKNVDASQLSALKNSLKGKSPLQLKFEEAQSTIDAFKALRMDSEEASVYETVGELLAEYDGLVAERDAFKPKRTQRATKKWHWHGEKAEMNVQITDNEGELLILSVHPSENSWRQTFLANEYTDGQIAAVRKERLWRKKTGFLTIRELENL